MYNRNRRIPEIVNPDGTNPTAPSAEKQKKRASKGKGREKNNEQSGRATPVNDALGSKSTGNYDEEDLNILTAPIRKESNLDSTSTNSIEILNSLSNRFKESNLSLVKKYIDLFSNRAKRLKESGDIKELDISKEESELLTTIKEVYLSLSDKEDIDELLDTLLKNSRLEPEYWTGANNLKTQLTRHGKSIEELIKQSNKYKNLYENMIDAAKKEVNHLLSKYRESKIYTMSAMPSERQIQDLLEEGEEIVFSKPYKCTDEERLLMNQISAVSRTLASLKQDPDDALTAAKREADSLLRKYEASDILGMPIWTRKSKL